MGKIKELLIRREHVMTKRIALFIIFFIFLSSGNAFAAFKCGRELINIGDDKMEVLLKCGEPSFSELTSLESGRRYGEDLRFGTNSRRTTYFVQKWYYNCGPHEFIRILTFRNGRVRDIEAGYYGSGESDCRGAKNRTENPGSLPPAYETNDPAYLSNPRQGSISVFGYPHLATVYLDQQVVGEVPFTLDNVRPGPHTLMIRKDAYKAWTKLVTVKPGETLYLEVFLDKDL
jgi:hypothetical protein